MIKAQEAFSEREYIINSFQKLFNHVGGAKMAIYGIGKNTQIVLENFDSGSIAGIMDEARTGDVIYGKKVISITEMIELGVKVVVIIARASNLKIIYRRIAAACAENAIAPYDINGNLISLETGEAKSFDKYKDINVSSLKRKINAAEVVSFDMFDTLIMRRALYPQDIFLLIEKEVGGNFALRRAWADTELIQRGQHPNIYDIYAYMGEFSPEQEIEYEFNLLVRREEVCEILDYALASGKEVYVVSDMYLTGGIIFDFLSRLNIQVKRENVIVSCDFKASKWTGELFGVLREKVDNKRILHIGDNYECDIKRALENGIDDTFQVEAAVKMLEDSYAEELLNYENTLAGRMSIGEFISRRLNSPFLFAKTAGKFEITTNYEMAYSFIAPLFHLFFAWLVNRAKELNLDLVLLPARDGYIFKQIYDIFAKQNEKLPLMKYFYISRAAAVLAGIQNDEDILYAARLEYSGSVRDMLKSRFLLTDDMLFEQGKLNNDEYVLLHKEAIMRSVKKAGGNFQLYINSFNLSSGQLVGYMDFIAVGHCQKFLGNIANFTLHGLYFSTCDMQIDHSLQWKKDIIVDSLMKISNVFIKNNNIFEMQFLLEPIITSFEPTLLGFDEHGAPVFFKDCRDKNQLADLAEIFRGIVDYVKLSKVSLESLDAGHLPLVDLLVSFLKPKYSDIKTNYFDNIEMKDPFNNRTFSFQLD
jgi:FMN phosphatase YigB (HAD superfamily)